MTGEEIMGIDRLRGGRAVTTDWMSAEEFERHFHALDNPTGERWRSITRKIERLRELDVPESALEPIERWRDEHCERP